MRKQTIYFTTLIILLSSQLFSQNNFKAEYKVILEKNGFAPMFYDLIGSGEKSIFKLKKRMAPDKVGMDEETGEIVLNPEIPDSIQPLILTNHKTKKVYTKSFITENDGESYQEIHTIEPIIIDWHFINETKKIDKYICKKATTKFRGRSYVAWYSEEIPISIGPWKFHGLPGVIINITDDTNKVSFIIEKIEIPYDSADLNLGSFDKTNLISIEELLVKRKNAKIKSEELFKNKILSKLPRGASIELIEQGDNEIEKEM